MYWRDKLTITVTTISTMIAVPLTLWLSASLNSCASLSAVTNTKTYVATTAQVKEVKKVLGIEDCPVGKSGVALSIEGNGETAVITVRCQ